MRTSKVKSVLTNAPPRTEVAQPPWTEPLEGADDMSRADPLAGISRSFMIMHRIAWNFLAVRGFVKKSAMFSLVGTKGTLISKDSTMSRTKKCRRATCFILSWCSGLYETSRADLLSVESDRAGAGQIAKKILA